MSASPSPTGQSSTPQEIGSKDLIIFPVLQTLKTQGVRQSQVGQGTAQGARRQKRGELTFYFSSWGRDFRHTQVGGGHNVIVGKAVPRIGDREGLNRSGGEDCSPPRRKWPWLYIIRGPRLPTGYVTEAQ